MHALIIKAMAVLHTTYYILDVNAVCRMCCIIFNAFEGVMTVVLVLFPGMPPWVLVSNVKANVANIIEMNS